jgi:sporulation protein YlmC with PRC-barrel domain
MVNRLAIGLMAGTLLSVPVLAQTSPAQPQGQMPGATAPAAGQSAVTPSQGGQIQYVTQNRSDLWRASQLEGLDVYNQNNEKVGDIREVLVNTQGQVEAVVIGVGGFLGIGERDVAVPYGALQWVNDPQRTATTTTGAAGVTGTSAGGATGATGVSGNAGVTGAGTMQQPTTTGTVAGNNRMVTSAGDQMRDYPERAVLPDATKDQLQNAPQFRYAQ